MKKLPENLAPYKKTAVFTEETIPNGLLNNHQTKAGVWGKIVILEGQLEYTIQEPEPEVNKLDNEHCGIVEPETLHHVKPLGSVSFYVEFYK